MVLLYYILNVIKKNYIDRYLLLQRVFWNSWNREVHFVKEKATFCLIRINAR